LNKKVYERKGGGTSIPGPGPEMTKTDLSQKKSVRIAPRRPLLLLKQRQRPARAAGVGGWWL
jgi:hypothetical protein